MSATTASRGPTRAGERALAPDLARGFMLLFIALANTVWYLWAAPTGGLGAHPEPGGPLDAIAQFFTIVAVDARSYPMFAFLFGYGIVQLATRQEAAGADPKDVSALLRRRNLWLLAFGFVHALLLWMGDVLGAYGLAGLLMCWLFLRRRDTTLLAWAGALTGVLALLSVASLVPLVFSQAASASSGADFMGVVAGNIADPSLVGAALDRAALWPLFVLVQGLVGMVVPAVVLLGFWAARRRILEEPGRHLPLLRRVAVGGIAAGWLGGLPSALTQTGVLDWSPGDALSMLDVTSGMMGGLGYVALIALVAHRIQRRGREPGVIVTALTATGRRSLSCYLAQSVLCAPLLAAWGLGLGAHLTSWSMFPFAVGVWLVTVVSAYALERAGRRGPAEVLLRRLSYRRPLQSTVARPDRDEDQERTTR
ncbi:hypothetical protein BJF83_09180 [Nocardiopsis sp. CNR-923]|uniref:DUF418 domain-containing protein n=1 Tax=Nocardiopsis sp. CNR-923 TaxID=1904965 RepID=UPI000969E72B|nr:DUF418 domain-containing protein [Nocardiopsis sp. CNR-923]OLT30127.1 hypothetical protein BJF83_09180 [Nocardiopsis sp. CNR-923]